MGKDTGAWLHAVPTTYNGTELSASEFRDRLHMRYCLEPLNLNTHCDGCGAKFSITHALSCKVGGLVHLRHNEVKEELALLCSQAFSPSAVRDEPMIVPSDIKTTTTDETTLEDEDRGDLLVRGLWQRGRHCVIDVRITDVNQPYQQNKNPRKILEHHAKLKKKKYLDACIKYRRDFTPFVLSTDGLVGKDAEILLKKLALHLSDKWQLPYSKVTNYVRTRIAIAVTRSTHMCIRGSRIPVSRISHKYPQWEDGAGLALL